jgi:integrase
MAYFRKRGDTWQAEVKKVSPPLYASDTFPTKAAAIQWANKTEADWYHGKIGGIKDRPFSDVIKRYRDEVSPTKRGARWEINRLNALLRDPLANISTRQIDATHAGEWRDRRLAGTKDKNYEDKVSASTVRRDWNLISTMCAVAVNEWKWIGTHPFKGVKKPAAPPARDRLVSADELEGLITASGYVDGKLDTSTAKSVAAFLFAIETGMRVGEICNLTWPLVDLRNRTAHLDKTKNGTKRDVPLSSRAVAILKQLPKDGDSVFNMTTQSVDALFRKVKTRAGIEDLHFHDSRHVAITQLSAKLDVLELARMIGHKNINELMTYYNKMARDIAKKLK